MFFKTLDPHWYGLKSNSNFYKDITIRKILNEIKNSKIPIESWKIILRNPYIEEYIKIAEKIPEEKKNGNIVVYRIMELQNYDEHEMSEFLSVSLKENNENYSISYTLLKNLLDYIIIKDEDCELFNEEGTIVWKGKKEINNAEVLETLFYELWWNWSSKETEKEIKNLTQIMKEAIKEERNFKSSI